MTAQNTRGRTGKTLWPLVLLWISHPVGNTTIQCTHRHSFETWCHFWLSHPIIIIIIRLSCTATDKVTAIVPTNCNAHNKTTEYEPLWSHKPLASSKQTFPAILPWYHCPIVPCCTLADETKIEMQLPCRNGCLNVLPNCSWDWICQTCTCSLTATELTMEVRITLWWHGWGEKLRRSLPFLCFHRHDYIHWMFVGRPGCDDERCMWQHRRWFFSWNEIAVM